MEDTMSHSWKTKRVMKAPKSFKKMKKRIRKAKERMAFKMHKEVPVFNKTNTWDYF
jgi:hypothetical protein